MPGILKGQAGDRAVMSLQDLPCLGQSLSHIQKMPRKPKITKGTSEGCELSSASVVWLTGSRRTELESRDGEIKQGKVDNNLDNRKK